MAENDADSEDDRDATGASGDESGGGAPTGGTPPPSEEELRRRRMQSELDQERARSARLQKQLDERSKAEGSSGEVDMRDVRAQIRAEVAHEHEMARTAEALKEEFPHAAELLRDTSKFESPEEMRYQALRRHGEVQDERDRMAEDVARRVREEYGEKLAGAPAGGGTEPPAPTDRLTAAAVGKMGVKDLLATDEDELARLARSFTQE